MTRTIAACTRGAVALEFLVIAPVFLSVAGGLLEFSYDAYVRSQVSGIVSLAARDATLESKADTSGQDALNARVTAAIRAIEPRADLNFTIESYRNYDAARDPAEPFIDANQNGLCDNGETYADLNGDGRYSQDSAIDGLGGADDIALYRVRISYDRLFGFMGALGLDRRATVTVTRLVKIQPYSQSQPIMSLKCT